MLKSLLRLSWIYFFTLLCVTNVYAAQDPIKMLDSVTQSVMKKIESNHEKLKDNPKKLYKIVDSLIIPHVDFIEMAHWVAGRSAWKSASKAEKDDFVKEFKTLVVRTYSNALLRYTNQVIEFIPYRGDYSQKKRIVLSSQVKQTGKKPIRLDYRLVKKSNDWFVYDIVIEGVSLLKGYQAQFSEDIRTNGLDAVTERIKEHNMGPAPADALTNARKS